MEKIDILFAVVTLFILSFSSTKLSNTFIDQYQCELDTVPKDIQHLKQENIELTKELAEKASKKEEVVVIRNTVTVKEKSNNEIVYLLIEGKVHEIKVPRDSGTNGFIVNIDSVMLKVGYSPTSLFDRYHHCIKYE